MARHEKFNLQNLALLDGAKIPLVFDAELKRAVDDCNERPALDKERQVSIVFKLRPISNAGKARAGEAIDCERIEVESEIICGIPKHKTQVYSMLPKADGSLVFHPDDPEDPNADLIFDEDAKKQDEKKKLRDK